MLLYRLVPPQKVRKFVVTCVVSVGTSNQHAGTDKPAYLDPNIFHICELVLESVGLTYRPQPCIDPPRSSPPPNRNGTTAERQINEVGK